MHQNVKLFNILRLVSGIVELESNFADGTVGMEINLDFVAWRQGQCRWYGRSSELIAHETTTGGDLEE